MEGGDSYGSLWQRDEKEIVLISPIVEKIFLKEKARFLQRAFSRTLTFRVKYHSIKKIKKINESKKSY